MKALLFAMVIQALSLRGETYVYSDNYKEDCSKMTIAEIAEDGYTYMPECISIKDWEDLRFLNQNNEFVSQHNGYHVSSDLAEAFYRKARNHSEWR